MRNRLCLLVLTALLGATPGCLWFQSVATDVSPVAVDRPPARPTADGARPDRTGAPKPDLAGEPAPGEGALPRVQDAAWKPVDPYLALAPGGLRIVAGRWDGLAAAHVSLTLSHRHVSGAQLGIASLAAEMTADAPLDDGTRASIRRAVEGAGGTLRIDVSPSTTRFSFTVAQKHWWRLIGHLCDAVRSTPTSGDRLAVAQAELLRRLGNSWVEDPLAVAVERVRAFELAGLPRWLDELEDARIDEVAAFHRENYRSTNAVIAVATSSAKPERVVEHVVAGAANWTAGESATLPATPPFLPPPAGVFWAPAPPPARVAAVVDLMPAISPNAAAAWIIAECLVGSGADGRIPDALRDLVPDLAMRVVAEGPRQRIELVGDVPPAAAPDVQRALADAVQSLRRRPPAADELRRAAARARLRLMLELRDPAAWCAEVTRSFIAGAPPSVILTREGPKTELPATTPLTNLAAALARPEEVDVAPVISDVAGRGALLVAIGADFSAFPKFAGMPDALIPAERRNVAVADVAAQETAARAVLDNAVVAVGGPAPLLGFSGLQAVSVTRSGRGPEAVDQEWYRRDGRFRRVRHVLASTIELVIGPTGANETCDGQTIALDEADAQTTLDGARRHPLALLAAWTRGEAVYRQTSLRAVNGRPMAVLERAGGLPGSLRLYVDAESGLIRAVVAREDRPTGTVYVREEWRDYRAAGGGLRAPHHRTTWVDDGARGLVTLFHDVDAEAPEPEWLQPGGPTR